MRSDRDIQLLHVRWHNYQFIIFLDYVHHSGLPAHRPSQGRRHTIASGQRRTSRKCHTRSMARGWESKSVESQIDAAEDTRSRSRGKQSSAMEAERNKKPPNLLLSVTRF